MLQLWYRDRQYGQTGELLERVLKSLDILKIHRCEECLFSTDCTHDCCFQLLKFHYEKHVSMGKHVQNKVGDDGTALDLKNRLGKRSRKQFEYQNSKMSWATTLQDMSIVENKSNKEIYSSFGQLVISIPLQTAKVNKMNLRSNNAPELPHLATSPKEDMIQLKPASKYKKTILSGKNLKSKTKKPSPSTLTISPDGETKLLRAFDFIYRPVNSEWRVMKCNEVLDNQTKSRSFKNDLDCSCLDSKKSVVKSKIPIIRVGVNYICSVTITNQLQVK